jgi:mono/diheme cytochrome c family protein
MRAIGVRAAWLLVTTLLLAAGPQVAAAGSPVSGAPDQQNAGFLGAGQSLDEAIKKGQYLARAGDCVACHTKHDGELFAGGLPMPTPFGTLYSPNITPDAQWGIGKWSADDFYNMLHTGHSRDGTLLYPAMPFPAYTKVTRADSDALFAYLSSLKPVHVANRVNELRFPYDNRSLLIGWRALFFREGEYQPDPTKSAQWNRGAYLVEGLGHCGTCHTAINALGGSSDQAFAGGLIPMQNWYAPSLTLNKEAGLGNWKLDDIGALLQGGESSHGAVYGPMSEVVENSLQYMNDADIQAMAVYLKTLPDRNEPRAKRQAAGVSEDVLTRGHSVYTAHCATCHLASGLGQPPSYPPLAGNPSIEMQSAVNPIRMVLNGGFPPETARNSQPYGMPPFAQVMSDEDVAAVVTYIRVAWGNHGQPVTIGEVNTLRAAPLLD